MANCLTCRNQIPEGNQWCSIQCKEMFYKQNFSGMGQRVENKQELERQRVLNSPEHKQFMQRCNEVGFVQAIQEQKGMFQESNEEKNKSVEKKGFLKKFWEKTIFPDILKRRRERKEKETEMRHKAKLKAMETMESDLAEEYKKKELEKMRSGGFFGKLAKEFKESKIGSDEKLQSMLGRGSGGYSPGQQAMKGFGGSGASNQEIGNMMGAGKKMGPSNDQIYGMLGRNKK